MRSGGLRVYTTILPRWQKLAQRAIAGVLTEPDDPAAAVISIDPRTGAIRAMAAVVPGRANNQFNLLTQARRQPGSTFKTFVLTAAVERGIDPLNTYYVSAPFTYRPTDDGSCEDETWWCVKTYDSSYYGLELDPQRDAALGQLRVRAADARRDAEARRGRRATDGRPDAARRQRSYVPAMGLGSIAVSPLDMASAYATLAAGGVYARPTAIRRVLLPGGSEDTAAGWGKPRRTRVISDGVAWEVTQILEENVRYGTGTRAQLSDRAVAGKTGTTDEHADAWFVGYTPDVSTAVWMGYTRGEIPMENVHGISVSGGSFPAEIWQRSWRPRSGGHPRTRVPRRARHPVEWEPFQRGPWALSYDPLATTETTETTTDPDHGADRARAARRRGARQRAGARCAG